MPLLTVLRLGSDVVWELDWIDNLRRVAAQYIWVTHREATDSPSLSEASTTAILKTARRPVVILGECSWELLYVLRIVVRHFRRTLVYLDVIITIVYLTIRDNSII